MKLLTSGIFYLEVTEQNCKDTVSHHIRVKPSPQVMVTADKFTASCGENIQLTASGATTYLWDSNSSLSCLDCADPSVSLTTTTDFCVEGELDGCSNEVCITIRIEDDCVISLPNIFTPNDDGFNDIWCSLGLDCIQSQSLSIYDRWGNLIYTTAGKEVCWHPSTTNPNLQSQVLTYVLHILFNDQKDQFMTGSITLIK